jgi:CHASE3 domain sensor protein
MDNLEQHFAAIRQEIDRLKVALQTTVDDAERHQLHTQINACIRESLRLIDQRLGLRTAATDAVSVKVPTDQPASERSVGGERS